MQIKGVDLSALGDQFNGFVQGRTLIVDADGPAYVAAATVKTVATAVRRFQQNILTQMFLTKSQDAILHLTASTSAKAGRFNIRATKPYQGQRDGKAKPALLEATRQAVAQSHNWLPEYTVVMNHIVEADDAMMMDAYRLKEHGLIWSADKDLRMTPYPYWDIKQCKIVQPNGFGTLHIEHTPAGQMKLLGYGKRFFWAQLMMGDTADYITGITRLDGKPCGPAGAYEFLKGLHDENECANAVLAAYARNKQNILPEGWLLWLLRWEGDTFWQYLTELNLTPENQSYLAWCSTQHWFDAPAEFDDVEY